MLKLQWRVTWRNGLQYVLDVQMWGSSGIVEAGIIEAKAFHLQCHCFES